MIQILFLSLVGALIGWFTNYLAVRLIFRPQLPWKIPFLPLEIQGLIPKRRSEIAKSIGETVAKELVTIDEVLEKLVQAQNKAAIIGSIKTKLLLIVSQRLPSILPGNLRKALLSYIGDILDQEMEKFIELSLHDVLHKASNSIDIGEMVEKKINTFDLDQLEKIILSISQKELKHIELLGGILGFVIGLLQAIIIRFLL